MLKFWKPLDQFCFSAAKVVSLQDENKPSSDEAKGPEVELKPLPLSLRCEILGPKFTYPVIVSAH